MKEIIGGILVIVVAAVWIKEFIESGGLIGHYPIG